MTNNSFYGLAFNPFDKQCLKVTDSFESTDHKEMISRLTYLTETKGIGVFTAQRRQMSSPPGHTSQASP